jgi:hypothetical protein
VRKVKSMLELTAKENPAVLVSSGNVSDRITHSSGPHDRAKLATYTQMGTTMTTAHPVLGQSGSCPPSPSPA